MARLVNVNPAAKFNKVGLGIIITLHLTSGDKYQPVLQT